MGKNVTLRMSLERELKEGIKTSSKAIAKTDDNARTFWVGYNQAMVDIRNRFFPELSIPNDIGPIVKGE